MLIRPPTGPVFFVGAALAALLAGGSLYLLFRPEDLVGFSWLNGGAVSAPVERPPGRLADFLIHSFPGGLWLLSATLLQGAVWLGHPGRARRFWLAAPLVLAIGWEAAQAFGVLRGTFDTGDVGAYLAAWVVGVGVVTWEADRL